VIGIKRLLVLLAATAAGGVLLECGARLEYRLSEGEWFPAEAFRERLAPAGDTDLVVRAGAGVEPIETEKGYIANKSLHPYLGYVFDHFRAPRQTNRFGFGGPDPLMPLREREVRVAITGGSVALQLYREAAPRLREELARDPAFRNRPIRLVALTLGGYKQPQQLMSLVWFLSLGAHFDVVVNLDGFNEIVLPYTDNVPDGVHPAYPRSWKLYAQKALNGAQIDALTQVRSVQSQRARWRSLLGTGLPSASAFALRVLDRIDAGLASELSQSEAGFRESLDAPGKPDYQVSGPPGAPEDERALFRELVALWASASRQMHLLCEANGIRYFHFLQPNQYVPGSKPFSRVELSSALRPGSFPPKSAVRAAYAKLSAAGADLAAQGVRFTDLTRLFEEEERTVYRDSCCHFNQLGIDAIATHVASAIRADNARASPAPKDVRGPAASEQARPQ
jgi:hypothetical protein